MNRIGDGGGSKFLFDLEAAGSGIQWQCRFKVSRGQVVDDLDFVFGEVVWTAFSSTISVPFTRRSARVPDHLASAANLERYLTLTRGDFPSHLNGQSILVHSFGEPRGQCRMHRPGHTHHTTRKLISDIPVRHSANPS